MTMKASAPLAIAVAIATVLAKEHQPTVAQTVFSIRGGETLPCAYLRASPATAYRRSLVSTASTYWTARRR
jgi:hypothetical protein